MIYTCIISRFKISPFVFSLIMKAKAEAFCQDQVSDCVCPLRAKSLEEDIVDSFVVPI